MAWGRASTYNVSSSEVLGFLRARGLGNRTSRPKGSGFRAASGSGSGHSAAQKAAAGGKQLQSLRAGERVDSKAAFKVLVRITFAVALAQHLSDLSCLLSTWETAPWVMEIDKDGGRGKKWRIFSNVFSFVLNNPRQVPCLEGTALWGERRVLHNLVPRLEISGKPKP